MKLMRVLMLKLIALGSVIAFAVYLFPFAVAKSGLPAWQYALLLAIGSSTSVILFRNLKQKGE